MNRSAYYEKMKARAREVRAAYGLTTPRVRRSDMRRIYKDQGIRIDLWPYNFNAVRGAYFDDECGLTVMICANLPDDPYIFTLGHELKHHLEDRALGYSFCSTRNETEPLEIGAEVFAAELIFPERDFVGWLGQMGIGLGECTKEVVVRLKRESQTTLSYTGLAKRATRMGFAAGSFDGVQWKKLEEEMYGVPVYRTLRRSARRC